MTERPTTTLETKQRVSLTFVQYIGISAMPVLVMIAGLIAFMGRMTALETKMDIILPYVLKGHAVAQVTPPIDATKVCYAYYTHK